MTNERCNGCGRNLNNIRKGTGEHKPDCIEVRRTEALEEISKILDALPDKYL